MSEKTDNDPFLITISGTLAQYRMLKGTKRLLVAVSGGRDSIALLVALQELLAFDTDIIVGHVHHGLRGEDADRDLALARDQAHAVGLPFISERLSLSRDAHTTSFEIPARKKRYDVFKRWTEMYALDALATGHTADDQVETILFRLLRGCSINSLSGIPSVRRLSRAHPCRVIRPLINCRRSEITAFLSGRSIPFRDDLSNNDLQIPRNRIRHQIIPLLKEHFNPRLERSLLRLQHEAALLKHSAHAETADLLSGLPAHLPFSITVSELEKLSSAACHLLLTEILARFRLPPEKLSRSHSLSFQKLIQGDANAATLTAGLQVKRTKDMLKFSLPEKEAAPHKTTLSLNGCTAFGSWELSCVPTRLTKEKLKETVERNRSAPLQHKEVVDGDLLTFPLTVRARRPGDRFQPLGAPGHTKIKEFLRASGIKGGEKNSRPVVLSGSEIIWVPGLRIAEKVKVDPSRTKNAVCLTCRRREAKT